MSHDSCFSCTALPTSVESLSQKNCTTTMWKLKPLLQNKNCRTSISHNYIQKQTKYVLPQPPPKKKNKICRLRFTPSRCTVAIVALTCVNTLRRIWRIGKTGCDGSAGPTAVPVGLPGLWKLTAVFGKKKCPIFFFKLMGWETKKCPKAVFF